MKNLHELLVWASAQESGQHIHRYNVNWSSSSNMGEYKTEKFGKAWDPPKKENPFFFKFKLVAKFWTGSKILNWFKKIKPEVKIEL